MDAFYASVEQKDNPTLRGKPVLVGGVGSRSVVAAASYEARKFGVFSALSMAKAMRLCPQAIVVKPRMQRYQEISAQLHQIFRKYTDLVEPLALDEAWLDVTFNKEQIPSATWVATHIKWDIENQLGLRSSAGVSYNKFLAKVASGIDKPNGLFVIPPEEAPDFLSGLPLSKFPGVGKVTEAKLKAQGLESGCQLLTLSQPELVAQFGKFGARLYQLVRGVDLSEVQPNRVRKSIGAEQTFAEDLGEGSLLSRAFDLLFQRFYQRLKSEPRRPKTLMLKVRFADFSLITRSYTDPKGLTFRRLKAQSDRLFNTVIQQRQGATFRLIGLSVSGFQTQASPGVARSKQLELIPDPNRPENATLEF